MLIVNRFPLFIPQRIEIDMLADKLNMAPAEAEKWVVNMIRLAHLDAKIDSKLKTILNLVQNKIRYNTNLEQ